MQRKAIVIGATGLVGQHLVKQLSELYDTLIVIARRPPRYINASMRFISSMTLIISLKCLRALVRIERQMPLVVLAPPKASGQ